MKQLGWFLLASALVIGAGVFIYREVTAPDASTYFTDEVRIGDIEARVMLKGIVAPFQSGLAVRASASRVQLSRARLGHTAEISELGDHSRLYQAVLRSIEGPPSQIAQPQEAPPPPPVVEEIAEGEESAWVEEPPPAPPPPVPAPVGAPPPPGDHDEAYSAILEIRNPDARLTIGKGVEARLLIGTVRQVPLIPITALGPKGVDGRYAVQVVKGRRVSQRTVSIGLDDGQSVEVKDGLQAGEFIVTGQREDYRGKRCTPWQLLFERRPVCTA